MWKTLKPTAADVVYGSCYATRRVIYNGRRFWKYTGARLTNVDKHNLRNVVCFTYARPVEMWQNRILVQIFLNKNDLIILIEKLGLPCPVGKEIKSYRSVSQSLHIAPPLNQLNSPTFDKSSNKRPPWNGQRWGYHNLVDLEWCQAKVKEAPLDGHAHNFIKKRLISYSNNTLSSKLLKHELHYYTTVRKLKM